MENITITKKFFTNRFAELSYCEDRGIALCVALNEYIPEAEFKLVFTKASELIKKFNIKKFVFDKRMLKVFHQPSMEWYHVEWKKEMYYSGLKEHGKILPQDSFFRKSVEIGRNKIWGLPDYQIAHLQKVKITYYESLEEAIA